MKKLTVSGDKTCCCKWIMRVIDSDPFFLSCHSSSSLQDQSQEVTWCPGERCQLKSITQIERPCFVSCLFLLWSACLVPDFSQSLWKTWHRMTWDLIPLWRQENAGESDFMNLLCQAWYSHFIASWEYQCVLHVVWTRHKILTERTIVEGPQSKEVSKWCYASNQMILFFTRKWVSRWDS